MSARARLTIQHNGVRKAGLHERGVGGVGTVARDELSAPVRNQPAARRDLGVGRGDQFLRGNLGAVARCIRDQVVFDAVAGDPTQGHPQVLGVDATLRAELAVGNDRDLCAHGAGGRVRAEVVDALHVTVDLLRGPGDSGVQRVGNQRDISARADLYAVEVAIGALHVAVGLVTGLL
jgi:hypothetical protein